MEPEIRRKHPSRRENIHHQRGKLPKSLNLSPVSSLSPLRLDSRKSTRPRHQIRARNPSGDITKASKSPNDRNFVRCSSLPRLDLLSLTTERRKLSNRVRSVTSLSGSEKNDYQIKKIKSCREGGDLA